MGGLVSKIPQLVLDKKARDGQNYKNIEIAEQLGITNGMVSLFLRDKVDISKMALGTALAWSDWLECGVRELFQEVE